jgi:hypothetical protein
MLIHNDVFENVVAIVTTRVLKDIHTLASKQPFIVLPLPSSMVLFFNTKGTRDSLLFPLPSATNNFHVPSKPTNKSNIHLKMTMMCFGSTYLSCMNNMTSGGLLASSW